MFLFLLLFAGAGVSQGSDIVEFVFSPTVDYRKINDHTPLGKSLKQIRDDYDTRRPGFRFGFLYSKALNPKLSIKSGINMVFTGTDSDSRVARFPSQHDGNGGHDPSLGDSEGEIIKTSETFYFIEIPLLLSYNQSKKKWKPIFEMGFSFNYLLGRRFSWEIDDESNSTYNSDFEDEVNRIQLSANVSLGMGYQINDAISLSIQPIIRYHLTPLFLGNNSNLSEYFYNYGFVLGLQKRI